MSRIHTVIDDDKHKQFKLYCVNNGISMTQFILSAINDVIGEECPNKICSFPMSQHEYIPASATAPGEYRCPSIDDDLVF